MILEKARDPKFWAEIKNDPSKKFIVDGVEQAYSVLDHRPISIRYRDFRRFQIPGDGNRTLCDQAIVEQSKRLIFSAFMALLHPEEEEHLLNLQDAIWAICDNYSWDTSAHHNGQYDDRLIGIMTANRALDFSIIYTLLGDRLDPLVKTRMEKEIERRVIHSYLDRHYFWETLDNNWNAVCVCGIVAALIVFRPDQFHWLFPRISNSIDCYLAAFKEDGACVEGAGYWNYGFGMFSVMADLICEFTEGRIDYFKNPKVKSIATFLQKTFLQNNTFVMFGDCGTSLRYYLGTYHLLCSKYPDVMEPLPLSVAHVTLDMMIMLYAFTHFDPRFATETICDNVTYCMKETQWFIKRTPKYAFATKGGSNSESHNHNDIGTFMITKDNRQILCELGAGLYDKAYFAKETRYTYFTTSSLGHSLPIINGQPQVGIPDTCSQMEWDERTLSIDLTVGYDVPNLTKATRFFTFEGDSVVCLTDRYVFEGEGRVTERFVTFHKPEITPDGIRLGSDALLRYTGATADVHEERYYNTPENRDAGGLPFYCIDFISDDPTEFSLRIEL